MNIAIIGFRGIPGVQGGIEKHCEELYPRIVNCSTYKHQRAWSVTIVGRKGYIGSTPYIYKGVRVIPIWSPRSKSLETMVHTSLCYIWLLKNAHRFNIVHVHAIGPSLFTPLLRLIGFKVIVTNHGQDYNREKWGWFAKYILKIGEYLGSKTAHGVIAVSRQIQSSLSDQYGIDASYIPNGVDSPQPTSAGPALEKFSLTKRKYVLYVGRLVPEKGIHDLIEAFASITTDWKLVIVGKADHENRFSRWLEVEASRHSNIVMTGFQKGAALDELYSNAGLFVLPSYHEGLPIVALEAMRFDLPILLSDIPANSEVASPGETFPVGNVNALAEKIVKIIHNPSGYFGSCNHETRRKRLSNEFDWGLISKKTRKVYTAINP